jgi:transcription antitermination factor NusG
MSLNTSGPRWYAVHTRSNFEKCVCAELSAKGVENYYPSFREVHNWADRKKVIDKALFPGYVFARFLDSGNVQLRIRQTAGAVRILGGANQIEPVPDEEIASVRKMLDSGRPHTTHPFLREGSWVRVYRGALKDVEGRLVRMKNEARLVVSISLLCRSVSLEVDVADVKVIRPSL